MAIIHMIREKLAKQEYEFTITHFFEEMADDNLIFADIEMKRKITGYNYGECEICDIPMQDKRIKQDFWIRGELIVVEDVPAGVCP